VINKDIEKIMGDDRDIYIKLIDEQEKLMVFNIDNGNNNEKFSGRQTMEIINTSINNNIKIETELGIRDYPTYTIDDYNNKMTAIKNYDFVHNNTRQRLLDKKSIDIERHIDNSNFYYPDEYYGIQSNDITDGYNYAINSDYDSQSSDDDDKIKKIKASVKNIKVFNDFSFNPNIVNHWKRFVNNYKKLKINQIILEMKDDEIEYEEIKVDEGDEGDEGDEVDKIIGDENV
jgi:hypothetical protein